ncbi:unnamed protein product [Moneuplotes crassus]|uniref:Vesicle transport protein GOT1B n=1 Tax=Euplotes crassus TaxID=5936 RepID=A0AAD1XU02_EUPCR|nr:unnamed protein product [Moneuplotes crassus]
MDDNKKIGLGLILLAILFFALSLLFMLDRAFLVMANMAFIAGFVMLIGVWGTLQFFMRRTKIKGSIIYFIGFVMIIMGFPFFTLTGFILQIYGVFLLFRSFIKTIFAYMQTMPVIGGFLRKSTAIHKLVDMAGSDGSQKEKAEV